MFFVWTEWTDHWERAQIRANTSVLLAFYPLSYNPSLIFHFIIFFSRLSSCRLSSQQHVVKSGSLPVGLQTLCMCLGWQTGLTHLPNAFIPLLLHSVSHSLPLTCCIFVCISITPLCLVCTVCLYQSSVCLIFSLFSCSLMVVVVCIHLHLHTKTLNVSNK